MSSSNNTKAKIEVVRELKICLNNFAKYVSLNNKLKSLHFTTNLQIVLPKLDHLPKKISTVRLQQINIEKRRLKKKLILHKQKQQKKVQSKKTNVITSSSSSSTSSSSLESVPLSTIARLLKSKNSTFDNSSLRQFSSFTSSSSSTSSSFSDNYDTRDSHKDIPNIENSNVSGYFPLATNTDISFEQQLYIPLLRSSLSINNTIDVQQPVDFNDNDNVGTNLNSSTRSIICQRKLIIRLSRFNISTANLWSPTPPRFAQQIERVLNAIISPNTAHVLPPPTTTRIISSIQIANNNGNVPNNQKRRRHAVIPHKVTYLYAINRSVDQIEMIALNPFSLGPLNNVCQHCGALFFEKEPKNRQGQRLQCCKNGDIDLPQLGTCPVALRNLYTEDGILATEFRTNIRTLNSLFALASFKTTHPEASRVFGQGHWCFTVCGQIYHYLDGIPIKQEQLESPRLSTYYFLDVDQALRKRNEFLNGHVSEQLIEQLERLLRQNHAYIVAYKTMYDVIKQHQTVNATATTTSTLLNDDNIAIDIDNVITSAQKPVTVIAPKAISIRNQPTRRQSKQQPKRKVNNNKRTNNVTVAAAAAAANDIAMSGTKRTRAHSKRNNVIDGDFQSSSFSSSSSSSSRLLTAPSNTKRTKSAKIPLIPNNVNIENIIIGFTKDPIMRRHLKTHNLPEHGSDIAAVFHGDEPPFEVNLKVYPLRPDHPNKNFRHQELKLLSPFADPFVYPLLFPCGDIGYSTDYKHRINRNKTVTFNEYYRYRLQIRDRFSTIHNGGKLFQQYVVDAWVKSETNRLWYLKRNQDKFRVVNERSLRQMHNRNVQHNGSGRNVRHQPPSQLPQQVQHVVDEHRQALIGKRYILPSSFPGGPRNKYKIYLESMAIISRHGKPDLFITFTCNPKWKEISDNLKNYQKWEHRSDLVCRVFHNRLLNFLNDFIEKQFYGVVHNYFYVIEFQKRGLPHAHILITFRDGNKILTSDHVDRIVHAYIPDKIKQPNLYKLVAQHQIHKPCGTLNPNAPCMDDTTKMCRKHFPKKYNPQTLLHLGDNKRPLYMRPADGRTIFLADAASCGGGTGGIHVTNTRVIPYNPVALANYKCHINFEAVGSIATIKYLHKYLYKGPDFVNLFTNNSNSVNVNAAPPSCSTTTSNINNTTTTTTNIINVPNTNNINSNNDGNTTTTNRQVVIDEIQNYIECRYVSSMEAMWRILEYPLYGRSHSVITLPIHLPNERFITFQEDDDIEAIDERLERFTKLEAWFRLNQIDAEARHHRYVDIPEHYVWDNPTSTWRKRKQTSKQIGCLIEITTAENIEKYYFSILLKYVTGATSYESLRSLDDGTICDTFKEACQQRNLIRHNDEFDKALADASLRRLPSMLRKFFALICCIAVDENIAEIPYLWNKYKYHLIEDLLHRGIGRRQAIDIAINVISKIVNRNRNELDITNLGIVNNEPHRQPIQTNNIQNIVDDQHNETNNIVVDGTTNNTVENDDDDSNVAADVYLDLIEDPRSTNLPNYTVTNLNKDQKKIYYEIVKTCATHDRFLIDMLDFQELLHPDDLQSLHLIEIDNCGSSDIEQLHQSFTKRGVSSHHNNNDDEDNDVVPNTLSLREIFDIDRRVNETFLNNSNPNGYIFYLDGPGGTGKTYLYNTIIQNLLTRYRTSPIAVAWTGIAANLLINGQTAHRAFKLPLNITNTTIPGWPLEHPRSTFIKNSVLVIWDEASMTNKIAVEAIDRYLRDLTKLDIPMGGKIVLFGGDFRQILPVVVGGGANAIISSCLKAWYYWPKIKQFALIQNMRAQSLRIVRDFGNLKFSDWLLTLGDGRLPNVKIGSVPDAPSDLIEVPLVFRAASIDELLQFVFQNDFSNPHNGSKAILCPTNSNVRAINERILGLMSTTNPIRTYFSIDEYEYEEDDLRVPQDLLHTIEVSSVPPHELNLTLGCIVILVKNIDIEAGQCNGSRYIITQLGDHFIEVEALQGQQIGQRFYLPKITMRANSPILPRDFKRTQFPIKLAYAITINKSQGQTLQRVGIYLQRPCFTHGQLYVSFSRVSNHENIKIFIEDRNDQGTYKFRYKKIFTRNVIYKSVLKDSLTVTLLADLRQLERLYDEHFANDENILPSNNINNDVTTIGSAIVDNVTTDTNLIPNDDLLFKKPLPPKKSLPPPPPPPPPPSLPPQNTSSFITCPHLDVPSVTRLKDMIQSLSNSFNRTEGFEIPPREIATLAQEIAVKFAKSHVSNENQAGTSGKSAQIDFYSIWKREFNFAETYHAIVSCPLQPPLPRLHHLDDEEEQEESSSTNNQNTTNRKGKKNIANTKRRNTIIIEDN